MKGEIREYAKLGLVHHMLHPECADVPESHVETLFKFSQRRDIETFDCCLPYGQELRSKLIPAIKSCGKSVCFAIHFYPLRLLPLAAKSPAGKAQMWMIIDDMIEQAASIGAKGFIFGAGTPSFSSATKADFDAFDEFCLELCEKLAPYGIDALLEPFDFDIDKKFLYGPIDDCVELAKRITAKRPNFGFELDMAHLPLMREPFESAIERCAPFLKRVHLGNCVLKDKVNPRYGDTHPPMGFPGGEIDVPELAVILRSLLACGFLGKERRGDLLVEMTPFPGKSVEETVGDNFKRLEEAWKMA